jgi:hypothetical protein
MTIRELKVIIAELPDHLEVCFEYDGPDANTEVSANAVAIYSDRILLVEDGGK